MGLELSILSVKNIMLFFCLHSIDKAMHSLGYKIGYALPTRHLPNPIDIVLVYCQKVTCQSSFRIQIRLLLKTSLSYASSSVSVKEFLTWHLLLLVSQR